MVLIRRGQPEILSSWAAIEAAFAGARGETATPFATHSLAA